MHFEAVRGRGGGNGCGVAGQGYWEGGYAPGGRVCDEGFRCDRREHAPQSQWDACGVRRDEQYRCGGGAREVRERLREFDPDYHQWRNEQLSVLDADYQAWRDERDKKFSAEFSQWRSWRSRSGKEGKAKANEREIQTKINDGIEGI